MNSKKNYIQNGIFFISLSFVLYNANLAITEEEIKYLKHLQSVVEGKFVISRLVLPLPYIFDYFFVRRVKFLSFLFSENSFYHYIRKEIPSFDVSSIYILKLTRILYSFVTMYLIYYTFNPFVLLVISLFTCYRSLGMILGNTYSIMFSILAIYGFVYKYYILSVIGVSLCVSTDICALPLLLIMILMVLYDIFRRLINDITVDNGNVRKRITLKYMICVLVSLLCLPILTYLLSFSIYYKLCNKYTDTCEVATIEFISTLKNDNIEESDLYVQSGSIVSILNRFHKHYLSISDNNVVGSKNIEVESLWVIKKVNVDDQKYIKDGDTVKLVNYNSMLEDEIGKTICINNVNQKDKFSDLEFMDAHLLEESGNDLFTIVCKGFLLSRKTIFKLKNRNSGLELGMRRFNLHSKSYINVNGSMYSNLQHRLFYISDSKFLDEHGEKTLHFPKNSFFKKFTEHNFHIFNTKNKTNFFQNILSTFIFFVLIPIFLLLNRISRNRYDKHIVISDLFYLLYLPNRIVHLCMNSIASMSWFTKILDVLALIELLLNIKKKFQRCGKQK